MGANRRNIFLARRLQRLVILDFTQGRNPEKELDPGSKPAPYPDTGSGMTEPELSEKIESFVVVLGYACKSARDGGRARPPRLERAIWQPFCL
ncbi:hypothetical protein AKJ60_00370 [candidate division MSBL1 archaeon SCGC-AAA385M11]|nr:hypothetical protein AKJ60_00370 [candidate division MSBL1 archaeon SCGC-AAA385M11]